MLLSEKTAFHARNPHFAEDVRASFAKQKIMGVLGAEIVDIRPGYLEIRLPFREELTQQHGFFHGGVIATLADSAGGYSAMTLATPGVTVLGVEFKINLLSPADGEMLHACAEVIRAGKRLVISQIKVYSVKAGQAKLCALMQMTTMMVDLQEQT